jgi:hypothetical protein
MSCDEIQLALGMGLTKGASVATAVYRQPVVYRKWRDGPDEIEVWETSKGSLRRVRRHKATHDEIGMVPHLTEYPIKTLGDYHAYIEAMDHLEFVPDPGYERFRAVDAQVGGNGITMVGLSKCPAHDMMLKWVGYHNFYYHLADEPSLVEAAIESANRANRPLWKFVAASPCYVVMHGGNYSSSITPPSIFRRFFLPYLRALNDLMHEAGKLVVCHTDGDMTGLLDLFVEAGFDGTNSFASAPLVKCTLQEAAQAWRGTVAIWGGVPSILLEPTANDEAFRSHLENILSLASSGVGFIVGISDHAMPRTLYQRLEQMARFFEENGQYPLRGR